MDIQSTKLELMQMLLSTQEESVLLRLKEVFDQKKADGEYVAELGCSTEDYNQELEEAERKIENGEYYTQEEVENKSQKW